MNTPDHPYIGESPMDKNETEPIHKEQAQEIHTPESSGATPETTTLSRQAYETPLFFDDLLVRTAQQRSELAAQDFTADELTTLQAENNSPIVTRLAEARAGLDAALSQKTTLFMKRAKRREAAQKRQAAQAAFDTAKEAYITSQLDPIEETAPPLARLTVARAQLAEATYAARQGNVGSNQRNRHALTKAQSDYMGARETYFDSIYTQHTGMSEDEKIEFISDFNDRERGALAGEEANLYLTESNDDTKKSRFQKLTERYNKLNRAQKISAGIGVAAIAGVGFGAIGGLAAVGGILGAKFGRNYFNGESARRNAPTDTRTQQENSVLYAGNMQHSLDERETLREANTSASKEVMASLAIQNSYLEQREAAILKESRHISKEKRRVIGTAALITAVPFVGGALTGAAVEHFAHYLSHGVFREHGLWGGHGTGPETHEPSAPSTETPPPSSTTPTSPPSPGESLPATPSVTPEQTRLYGDYAGQELNITVPQGSSIWEQVSQNVSAKHPFMSYSEHERITGNLVNKILIQQPSVDPYSVPVGARFSAKV